MNDLLANVLAISIRGFHSFSLLSKCTMSSDEDSNSDIMATFLLPGHCANPQSFVTNYYQAAKNSTNPEHSLLDRHLVTDYGVNKTLGALTIRASMPMYSIKTHSTSRYLSSTTQHPIILFHTRIPSNP
jgi:hypothetical protein